MRHRREKISSTVANKIRTGGIVGVYTLSAVAALIALSAGFIFGYDVLTQMDGFAAEIRVEGIGRLSEKEILEQAEISPGVNLFSLNPFLIRKRLLAHPWVASAEVDFQMHAKVTLRIVEQVPLAVVDLGRQFILNAEGFIFKEKSDRDRMDLPVIEGLEYSDIPLPGDREEVPFGAVKKFLALGGGPDSLLNHGTIQKIRVDRDLGLSIEAFGNGTVIKLGYHDYPEKIRSLGRILAYCRQADTFNKLRWIDLNDLNRIVVNPLRDAAENGDKKEA
ncbi:MAG: FtsQ-type POTRA domain-containing protein [Desulfobacteraceae bacterium]|nr:MAG: FtsQ-type POTRA domain-containing protein [Desulfobacteraceae bacterium]